MSFIWYSAWLFIAEVAVLTAIIVAGSYILAWWATFAAWRR